MFSLFLLLISIVLLILIYKTFIIFNEISYIYDNINSISEELLKIKKK
jgi:hypothetical protein